MGSNIMARREAQRSGSVYGILDGDFRKNWSAPQDKVDDWKTGNSETHFGWRWERKEIENYLVDPVVVEKALGKNGPTPEKYKAALESARDNICIYQAARTALSANRIRFNPMPSAFGRKRGKENHPFPDEFKRENCIAGIKSLVDSHKENQTVDLARVTDSFKSYLPEFQEGSRWKDYLYAFAGKDLFWAMDQWCKGEGFYGAMAFREKILSGIQKTTEDISTWLPEWRDLKETIARI